MRNKLTYLLMAGAMAWWSACPLHAQTDVTETYLKNPSFENGFTDWDYANMQSQTNTDFSKKDGTTYVEQWVGQGNRVADCHVSQVLTGLPNGTYQLTAAAQNIQQNNTGAEQSGVYIFAEDEQTAVHAANDYSVTFTVIEGQATVGFKAENATGNWITCDNFRLSFLQEDVEAVLEKLQERVNAAQELVSETMQKDLKTELNAAIQAAQQEVDAATGANTAETAVRLREAVEAAETSIEAYAGLQEAIAEAKDVYGDGSLAGADKLDAAIQDAQGVMDDLEADTEAIAETIAALEDAALAFNLDNATGTAPTVVTDTRYARGSVIAFGRSTVSGVSASELLEQGFCWSTSPEPTILDHRTTEYLENNGRIYVMRDLEPSTIYYIRAYAMTKGYAVGYGDAVKVITIPEGTITWQYNDGGPADANARIRTAVGSAVDYWNMLTSIKGLHLNVNYGAQTPTADCSYGGWMRVGPNASYQRTGTIMHEMGHAVGVGTHNIWWNAALRANGDRGDWLGERANEVLRFWDNDPTAVMTGDNTHMWPYGINGEREDSGSEVLYFANGLITQALGEDGLPPTGGFSTPAYAFEQEDDVKYYIKNESEETGLYSSYLVASGSAALNCKEMTAAEAAANDSAAWYITFNPTTCYYQFRNVGTGKYITYSNNRFRTAEKSTPSTTESFQVMRGRVDVSIGTGSDAFATRGHWIIYPNNTATPNCMSCNAAGRTSAAEFNISNSAESQRWVFLTGEDLQTFDTAVKAERQSEFEDMLAQIKALAETPHTEDVAGADATLASALSDIETRAGKEGTTAEEFEALTEEARAAGMAFLAEATPTSKDEPFDLTFLMSDAGLTNGDGWSSTPNNISFSCAEFFERSFDFYQYIPGLPAGTYQFKGQGFQRPGEYKAAYNAYVEGQNDVNAMIYAGDDEVKLQHIAAEAQDKKLGGSEMSVGTPTKYIPNDMEAASKYFAKGLYDNGVVTQIEKDDTRLKVGISCDKSETAYWCIFDNFHLYYYGTMSPDLITAIHSVTSDKVQESGLFATPADIYSLSGVCVRHQATSLDGLQKGIYIVKGKKVLVR